MFRINRYAVNPKTEHHGEHDDEADGAKSIFYQVDLDLINLENNVKSWYGQKKIKKVVERKRLLF